MTRTTLLIAACMTCLVATYSLLAAQANAATLREQSIVSDDVIRLGDLFHDLNHSEDRVLGASPRPGKQMVLNARTLQRVAIAMDLQWRPTSLAERITIHRAATVIDKALIQDKITAALRDKIRSKHLNLAFAGAAPEITLPPTMNQEFEITHLSYNPENRWFEAQIAAPSQTNLHTRKIISGRVEILTQIPVLSSTLRAGDVIRKNDIELIEAPAHTINHDTYLRADKLIGLTPRRIVAAGSPIKENDLQEPQIIKRGELVTMIYDHQGLRLTSTGKALQSGAKGDFIRVVNNQSSKTLEATITGKKEVIVQTF